MTRHCAGPNINRLWTRNLPFEAGILKLTHYFMIPLHCLRPKSNHRTCGQFECDVLWFCFDFVRSREQWGYSSVACLHFQFMQMKQADCKISNTNVKNYKFRDIFGQLHKQEYKATKKQIVKLQLNEKKSKESQTG